MINTRNETAKWAEIKQQHLECLCYSKKDGFYTKRLYEKDNPEDLLYRPHGYKGFVSDTINVPEEKMNIKIESNFGYGSKSYLRAVIERDNRRMLDFDLSKVYILNNCSVATFDVPLYEWDTLFKKIISCYKESLSIGFTTLSIAYLDEISAILDKEEIFINGIFENNKKGTKWDGDFLISLYVGNKIRDLLRGFEIAKVSDPILLKYMLNLCRKYVHKVRDIPLNYDDPRTSQISETLMLIHKYMCDNKTGTEYLNLLLNK